MNMDARIAVIGCGLGGAATAALLQRAGFNVSVFEQAAAFQRIGAGIHLTPNLVNILRHLGADGGLIDAGFKPSCFVSREASGRLLGNLDLSETQATYGAPYLTVHRGDFHRALVNAVSADTINFNKQLQEIEYAPSGTVLTFADGTRETFDLVIGADGLSSKVRSLVCGPEKPVFAGQVAYRGIINTSDLSSAPREDLTKWWSEDKFIISYYLDDRRSEYYFVAGLPAQSWPEGVQAMDASIDEMVDAFGEFEPWAQEMLSRSSVARKWPLFERKPEAVWYRGNVVILGDACHPMRPHMAQGAAMAIEDGMILTRCLVEAPDMEIALRRYQLTREARVAEVQKISNENTWLKSETNPDWLFAYDAAHAPLAVV